MQTDLIKARVADLQNASLLSGAPKFFGFLTSEEVEFVKKLPAKETQFSFFGGYEGAERVFLGISAYGVEPSFAAYPIEAITFSFRAEDSLTHRDFLGALMSKGIKRETIGDILVERGRAVLFASRDISRYICEQTTQIGRTGVNVKKGAELPLPAGAVKVQSTDTVASLRLDCVVAALIGTSRDKSSKIISDGLVTVNSVITLKATRTVAKGDKISVRGYGKFTVISADGVTRKGRTVLITEKYK